MFDLFFGLLLGLLLYKVILSHPKFQSQIFTVSQNYVQAVPEVASEAVLFPTVQPSKHSTDPEVTVPLFWR